MRTKPFVSCVRTLLNVIVERVSIIMKIAKMLQNVSTMLLRKRIWDKFNQIGKIPKRPMAGKKYLEEKKKILYLVDFCLLDASRCVFPIPEKKRKSNNNKKYIIMSPASFVTDFVRQSTRPWNYCLDLIALQSMIDSNC